MVYYGTDKYYDKFDVESSLNLQNSRPSNLKKVVCTLFAFVCTVTISIIVILYNRRHKQFIESSANYSHNLKLTISVTNEYSHVNQTTFSYSFLKDAILAEPWRDNNMTVSGLPSSCVSTWSLNGKNTLKNQKFYGKVDSSTVSFAVTPKKTGFYTLTITSKCDEGNYVSNQNVVVKYVRRELASLTDNDREEFLDAMYTLWTVDTVTGQKLYGEKYKSLHYFAAIHNDGGSNQICDEFHRNAGFLNNHVFIGAYLEQSLQLVNPRTALHYWEYTRAFSSVDMQQHVVNQLDGGAWTEIMTEKYFGASDPITGEILTGRWAHTEMPRVTPSFFAKHGIDEKKTFFPSDEKEWLLKSPAHLSSPYGYLRSRWNWSPASYLQRFNNAVQIANAEGFNEVTFRPFAGSTCADYKMFIKEFVVNKPLDSYLQFADAQAHGYTHYTIGGSGGDQCHRNDLLLKSQYNFTDDDIAAITTSSSRFFKAWTTVDPSNGDPNPISCNNIYPWDETTYTLSTDIAPGEVGGPLCELHSFYFETEERADYILADFFLHFEDNEDIRARDIFDTFTFDQKKGAMKLMFSRMQIDGDMAGASSAVDPLFWVAHGAVERLYQRTMFEDVLSDKEYILNGVYGSDCQGHNPDLSIYWLKGYAFEDTTVAAEEITHRELAAILDPTGSQYATYIPFIYDTADFDWCEGFDNWWRGEADDDRLKAPEPATDSSNHKDKKGGGRL